MSSDTQANRLRRLNALYIDCGFVLRAIKRVSDVNDSFAVDKPAINAARPPWTEIGEGKVLSLHCGKVKRFAIVNAKRTLDGSAKPDRATLRSADGRDSARSRLRPL
jgi:hypothetical protein